MVYFQASAYFFVQLLEPDTGLLFANRSEGWGPITDPFRGSKRTKTMKNNQNSDIIISLGGSISRES